MDDQEDKDQGTQNTHVSRTPGTIGTCISLRITNGPGFFVSDGKKNGINHMGDYGHISRDGQNLDKLIGRHKFGIFIKCLPSVIFKQ